ncbi:interleukin-17C [Cyclopterus lumpus]|uniref:interleukin-17C n=1 Tax=Cyclopterus lumpus TaxID=8103 RepID=UPI0014873572|nr:interleukin-17C [Cyclopterus lumpus]
MEAGKREAEPLVHSQRERQKMDMKQILIVGLCLVPVWACKMNRCYDDSELVEAAQKKLRSHYPQPLELATPQPDSEASCPVALFPQQAPEHIRDRSLSPWRYVLVTKKDHFPSSYVEAQCLCSGCILIQGNRPPVESHNYNSYPVIQSRVFLKKELCGDKKTYYLKPVAVKVAVGCTCTRANSYT